MSNELLILYIFMFIFIYVGFADAVKIFQLDSFFIYFQGSSIFFQVTLKVQAFSSKLLSRSGILFQDTSKIRHFLPSYFQDQAISSKLLPRSDFFLQGLERPDIFLQDLARPDIFLQDLARPDIFFQDLPRYLQE